MSDSNLLASLGLEFVDLNKVSNGLKALKPTAETQIFSVIKELPGLPNTMIRYERHDFYNQIKRRVRCWGGSCCIKAKEIKDWIDTLPADDERRRQKPYAQVRYAIPVVLYQGKSASAYGGPIEVRYLDIAAATLEKWNSARAAVNEDIAPFYERDFIMTEDTTIKNVPVMTHMEGRAKWLTDAAIHAEVLAIINNPKFIEDFAKAVPPRMEESEFLNLWRAAMTQPQQTVAERVLSQPALQSRVPEDLIANVEAIQPAIQQPIIQGLNLNSGISLNTPAPLAQPVQTAPQPAQVAPAPQPAQVAPAQVAQEHFVPVNTGLNTGLSGTSAKTDVPFTPQNVINGSYSAGVLNNTIAPENIVNMQPVQVAPAQVVEQVAPPAAPQQPEQPAAPAVTQTEINLNNIGDLSSIINNLPPV